MAVFFSSKKSVLAVSAAIALSFTTLSPAYGLDKDTFMKRLQAATAYSSFDFSSKDIEINGNNIVLHDVIAMAKEESEISADNQLMLGDIFFDNITEEEKRYVVGKVRFSDILKKDGEAVFSIKGASFDKLILNDVENSTDNLGLYYEGMHISSTSYSWKGNTLLEINGLNNNYDAFDKKAPVTFSSKIDSFTFTAKSIEDVEIKTIFQELGYDIIKGNVYISGSWDMFGNGELKVNDTAITAENIGTLKTNLALTGLTNNWFKEFQDLKSKAGKEATAKNKTSFELMTLSQQLKIENLKIRYEDLGLTNSFINFRAKVEGVTPDELKVVIKGLTPIIALQLKSPVFSKEVEIAAKAFIDDPKSLELTIKPENKLSLAELVLVLSISQNTSAKIIEMLNLHLTANN